jgi:hypothetical protein
MCYDELGRQPGILPAGCWAYVRRAFYEAYVVTRKPGTDEDAIKQTIDCPAVRAERKRILVIVSRCAARTVVV